eukprot:CAMPEP_0172672488 /NCGR_PEP_ID=MMETSP1074-20121228/11580_1 /TAXON_ID=2916 /ORGANISM="Ceratium fusus, Strain PA161109" /LENGTH=257 /DNA_ID=CAMNT_0013489685 /DNA_START=52 /DNA_END=825 /DNA_ORIENTATION=-
MAPLFVVLLPLLAAHGTAVDEALDPVLRTPDRTPYDPTTLLCQLGKDAKGEPKVQGWCRKWLACVERASQPKMDAAAVLAAWKPADCREVCGKWPVLKSPEKKAALLQQQEQSFLSAQRGASDCMKSCQSVQSSLSTCVATVLFEPGKVQLMGLPDKKRKEKKVPPQCEGESSPCKAELPVNYQKCMATSSKKGKDCEALKTNVNDCKGCPQMEAQYLTQYQAFVGGCLAQLNAYRTATHPKAGVAAIPGPKGCEMH